MLCGPRALPPADAHSFASRHLDCLTLSERHALEKRRSSGGLLASGAAVLCVLCLLVWQVNEFDRWAGCKSPSGLCSQELRVTHCGSPALLQVLLSLMAWRSGGLGAS